MQITLQPVKPALAEPTQRLWNVLAPFHPSPHHHRCRHPCVQAHVSERLDAVRCTWDRIHSRVRMCGSLGIGVVLVVVRWRHHEKRHSRHSLESDGSLCFQFGKFAFRVLTSATAKASSRATRTGKRVFAHNASKGSHWLWRSIHCSCECHAVKFPAKP